MTQPDRDQSEFNMAVSYLNRLNALFYAAAEAAIALDAHTWLHCLMAISRELSTEMLDKEVTAFTGKFDKISQEVNASNAKQIRTGRKEVPTGVYKNLHSVEIDLRKILKKAGLQSRMVDPAGAALI